MSSGVRGKGSSRSASSEGNCHWGTEVVCCSRISIVGGTSSWKETLFPLRLCLSSCYVISRATPFAPTHPLQELTHVTDRERGVLLVNPCVLYGSCCAKYAAAFFKMSRSSFKRAFSFRRRLSSSYKCS